MELGIEWDLEEELESLGIKLDHRDREDEEINSLRELRDRYNDLAKETQKLIDRGALLGDEHGNLDVTMDMLRTMIVCQRMIDEK